MINENLQALVNAGIKVRNLEIETNSGRPRAVRFDYGKRRYRLSLSTALVEHAEGGILSCDEHAYRLSKKLGLK